MSRISIARLNENWRIGRLVEASLLIIAVAVLVWQSVQPGPAKLSEALNETPEGGPAPCAGECRADCLCIQVCGNSLKEGVEECDGADLGRCPYLCGSDCKCLPMPVCGNGAREGTEECDGPDSPACPGECEPDCKCVELCGNNVRDSGEQCDSSDSALCPGLCTQKCLCPMPVCGNNVKEITEQCDGADDLACPSKCEAGCRCG